MAQIYTQSSYLVLNKNYVCWTHLNFSLPRQLKSFFIFFLCAREGGSEGRQGILPIIQGEDSETSYLSFISYFSFKTPRRHHPLTETHCLDFHRPIWKKKCFSLSVSIQWTAFHLSCHLSTFPGLDYQLLEGRKYIFMLFSQFRFFSLQEEVEMIAAFSHWLPYNPLFYLLGLRDSAAHSGIWN